MRKSADANLPPLVEAIQIGTPRHSRGFFICGQSPLLLATPQGVSTVCHLRKISACYP